MFVVNVDLTWGHHHYMNYHNGSIGYLNELVKNCTFILRKNVQGLIGGFVCRRDLHLGGNFENVDAF